MTIFQFLKNKELSSELKQIKKELTRQRHPPILESQLNRMERHLMKNIDLETKRRNINNITRTKAYLDYYNRYPEIHWAFLGHMVSRNGGWNMTDLRGSMLSRLLSEKEQKQFFAFLERGNWLIFQDIYPQLLLYAESVKQNNNLCYLLPVFHVSLFMQVIWNHFYNDRDEYLLTMALIVNEQSYLEKRMIQNPYYQTTVLDKSEFKLQELLELNQILFPYADGSDGKEVKIIGQTIHQFASLHDRILLGKHLYKILYDLKNYPLIYKWAASHAHTGSRKDFWPQLFNDINESAPWDVYHRRIKDCRIRQGAPKLYSPVLRFAWDDAGQKEAEVGDWYSNWKVLHYLKKDDTKVAGAIYRDYCKTLEKMEIAIVTKEAFLPKKA